VSFLEQLAFALPTAETPLLGVPNGKRSYTNEVGQLTNISEVSKRYQKYMEMTAINQTALTAELRTV